MMHDLRQRNRAQFIKSHLDAPKIKYEDSVCNTARLRFASIVMKKELFSARSEYFFKAGTETTWSKCKC